MKRILMDSSGIIAVSCAARVQCSSDSSTLRNSESFTLFAEGSLYINRNRPNELAIGFAVLMLMAFVLTYLKMM